MNFKLIKYTAIGVLLAGFSWNASALLPAEDGYEVNNELTTASDLTADEGSTISNLIALDEDWYQIEVTPGFNRVQVDITFTHATDDLDLYFYDSAGNLLDSSTSIADSEAIEYDVSLAGGIYYIQVRSFNSVYAGAIYSLVWDDVAPFGDDIYENNDTAGTATDLTAKADVWLSDHAGAAQAGDDDWYRITVTSDTARYVVIDATFTHADADIDIELWDYLGITMLAMSDSRTDDERIGFNVDAQGDYLVKVLNYGGISNTPYDLKWNSQAAPVAEDSGSFGVAGLLLLPLLAVFRRRARF